MAGKARDVKPTGPEGFGASSSLVAQVGGLSVPSDAKPLDDQRDRPAVAVAVRVPGRPARRPDLLLRRAGRPGRHRGRPPHHLDRRHAPLVHPGARRPGRRGPRRRRPRPGSGPIARASTRGSRPSSPAPPTRRCGPGCAWSAPTPTRQYVAAEAERPAPRPRGTCSRRSPQSAIPGRQPVTPPTDRRARPAPRSSRRRSRAAAPGWIERATSADHKSVGLLYIGTALCFLAARGGRVRAHAGAADRAREHR